ncbi:unnamed protein product [Merluccius merluccius]
MNSTVVIFLDQVEKVNRIVEMGITLQQSGGGVPTVAGIPSAAAQAAADEQPIAAPRSAPRFDAAVSDLEHGGVSVDLDLASVPQEDWRSDDGFVGEAVKRHTDAIFTDNYSRFRKQMAVKKYLTSVLTGKRSRLKQHEGLRCCRRCRSPARYNAPAQPSSRLHAVQLSV